MAEDKPDKSALDVDYDQDSWLGQKEVSFSSKILAVAGGITSFGGLFPLLLDKMSAVSGGAGIWYFVIFTVLYFAAPLLLFVIWTWISDRVVWPNQSWSWKQGWNYKAWKNSPVTYRFQWLIFIQSIVIVLYLILSIDVYAGAEGIWLLALSSMLLVTPMVALHAFSRRKYEGQKITFSKIIFVFMVLVIGTGTYLFRSSSQHKHDANKADYEQLVQVDYITNSLDSLEKYISNKVDRFYLKSSIQAKVTLGDRDSIESRFDFSEFYIDEALEDFDRLMLGDATCCLDSVFGGRTGNLEVDSVRLSHAKHKIDDGTADKFENHSHLFLAASSHTEYFRVQDSIDSYMPEMRLINRLITDMIEQHNARVYPSCLMSSVLVNGDSSQIELAYADTFAAQLNLRNSSKLKNWVDEFYLPYCKRKAMSDVDDIVAETSWIWRDMQLRGIAISIATLLLLALFYLEMIDLKLCKIRTEFPGKTTEESEEEKAARLGFIEELNNKASYLLFPLTMTISVIGLLLIPVTSQTEIASITPGKSFWMMNVPSLNMPDAVEEIVTDDIGDNSKLEEAQLEINELRLSLDSLNGTLSSLYLDTSATVEEKKRTWKRRGRLDSINTELNKKIGGNSKEIDAARKYIKELEEEAELLKKQLEEQDELLPDP